MFQIGTCNMFNILFIKLIVEFNKQWLRTNPLATMTQLGLDSLESLYYAMTYFPINLQLS